MARKPATYDHLTVIDHAPEPEPVELPPPTRDVELLKDISAQVVFYMSAECHKALMRFSVEKSVLHGRVKVHDLLCEALQEWVDRKGLNVTVRAKEKKRKTRRAE
jgi:hypothetical protein